MKFVLTIAGSDPTGGAGIQADLKTIAALGAYGLSAVTAITSQTLSGVKEYIRMDPSALRSQVEHLYKEFKVSAVKTGMLASSENVKIVSEILYRKGQKNIVVDPIIFSGNGVKLIDKDGILTFKYNLFPLASIVTPNLKEASIFTENEIKTVEEMIDAAKKISQFGCKAVLVKGGHLAGDPVDVLYHKKRIILLPQRRIKRDVHGAGCAFSSALATMLARGTNLEEAVRRAQNYTFMCIRQGFRLKKGGRYLLNHI